MLPNLPAENTENQVHNKERAHDHHRYEIQPRVGGSRRVLDLAPNEKRPKCERLRSAAGRRGEHDSDSDEHGPQVSVRCWRAGRRVRTTSHPTATTGAVSECRHPKRRRMPKSQNNISCCQGTAFRALKTSPSNTPPRSFKVLLHV